MTAAIKPSMKLESTLDAPLHSSVLQQYVASPPTPARVAAMGEQVVAQDFTTTLEKNGIDVTSFSQTVQPV